MDRYSVISHDLYLEITPVASNGADMRAGTQTAPPQPTVLHVGNETAGIRFYADESDERHRTVYAAPGWNPRERPAPFLDLAPYESDIARWREALQRLPSEWYECKGRRKPLIVNHVKDLPTFEGVGSEWRICLGFAATGAVYWGLHCLAWYAPFPSRPETVFWRVSSAGVSCTGVLLALLYTWEIENLEPFWRDPAEFARNVYGLAKKLAPDWAPERLDRRGMAGLRFSALRRVFFYSLVIILAALKVLYDVGIVLLVVCYCLARVYLVVESFVNLVHLPDSAYVLPSWSQYMPHIG